MLGAVLSAPAIRVPDNTSQAVILMRKFFSALIPKVRVMGLIVNAISRDPRVVDAYVNDPLVHKGKGTARLGAEILKTMRRVTEQAAQITLPILILQGSDDELVDPTGGQLFYDSVGSRDKTLKIYDGLYHKKYSTSLNMKTC